MMHQENKDMLLTWKQAEVPKNQQMLVIQTLIDYIIIQRVVLWEIIGMVIPIN